MSRIEILKNSSTYKIGMNEIKGLKQAIADILAPTLSMIQEKIYWKELELDEREYLPRDGFIPHSHNYGGLELSLVIPKIEESEFDFLEFGEYENLCEEGDCGECDSCTDMGGNYDAFMKVAVKFEGLEDEKLKFYIYLEGGNYDAPPYFRSVPTIYEADFEATSLEDFKKKATRHLIKINKIIKGV